MAKVTKHIGILYLKEGEEWAKYLKSLFLKDDRLELEVVLQHLGQEQADVTNLTSSCLVTILLMTPDIMDWLTNIYLLNSVLKDIPQHRELVGMSAFIDRSEYSAMQKACSASSRWTQMTLTETITENIKMVAEIIALVEKVEKAEKQNQAPLPKKRTTLERSKAPKDQESQSTSAAPEVLDIFPSKVFTAREKVVIVFKEPVDGTIHVSFKDTKSGKLNTKKLNPYCFRFRTPDPFPNSNMLEVFLDGKQIAAKHVTFVKPTQSALQSIGYLMQILGVENTVELDQRLCDIFERSMPRDKILNTLFSNEEIQLILDSSVRSMTDFPTLLHFSAAHGLSDFTSLLLELPGAMAAFNLVNQRNQNPAEIAASNQHHDLARYITDFTDTNAIVDACGIYVSMCGTITEDQYVFMGGGGLNSPTEDLYSKALDDMMNTRKIEEEEEEEELELEPPPPLPPARNMNLPPIPPQHRKLSLDNTSASQVGLSTKLSARGPSTAPPTPNRPKDFSCPQPLQFENPTSFLSASAPARKLSQGAMGSSAQQELIDIQVLVRNNEYTIDEALMIYNSWKDRPASQSFKDRKKNLEELKSKASIVTNQTSHKSLLKRLISFRKTKRQDKDQPSVQLTDSIYETFPIPRKFLSTSLHRASSLSNSSSSSGTSRESGVSIKEMVEIPSSDSEDEERTVRTRRNRSNSNNTAEKRKSKKDMYLEGQGSEKEVKLPPLPPRRRQPPPPHDSPPQLPKSRSGR